MKKLCLLPLLVVTSISCNRNDDFLNEIEQEKVSKSEFISQDSIKRLALELPQRFGLQATKSSSLKISNITPVKSLLKKEIISKTSSDSYTPELFVVNYEDDNGFAIIGNDAKLSTNVFAFSDDGNFDTDSIPAGVVEYLHDADSMMINYSLGLPDITLPDPEYQPDTTQMPRNWGIYSGQQYCWRYDLGESELDYKYPCTAVYSQRAYLNENGSQQNFNAGCNAIAMCQIMSKYCYPSSAVDYSSVSHNIDWELLQNMKSSSVDWTKAANQANLTILIDFINRTLGVKTIFMNGTPTYAASIDRIHDGFIACGYTSSQPVDFNTNTVLNEIDNGRPVFTRGKKSDSEIGHVWTSDGYICSTRKFLSVVDYVDGIMQIGQSYREGESKVYYLHHNWGWGGSYNGYYLDFNIAACYERTAGWGNEEKNSNFSEGKQMIYNIKPNN